MTYNHAGSLIFDDWHSFQYEGGWSDTFVLHFSANAGLPPMDYARAIRRLVPPLAKLRRGRGTCASSAGLCWGRGSP